MQADHAYLGALVVNGKVHSYQRMDPTKIFA